MSDRADVAALITRQIELYYLKSFRCFPEELADSFLQILGRLEEFSRLTSSNKRNRLNQYLLEMLDGQQRCDYVAIRDILYYEIKPWLEREFH